MSYWKFNKDESKKINKDDINDFQRIVVVGINRVLDNQENIRKCLDVLMKRVQNIETTLRYVNESVNDVKTYNRENIEKIEMSYNEYTNNTNIKIEELKIDEESENVK